MSHYPKHYKSGEELRTGDHVSYHGNPGHVVFVLSDAELPAAWAASKPWFESQFGHGFMLQIEGMGPVFLNDSDEDLLFLAR